MVTVFRSASAVHTCNFGFADKVGRFLVLPGALCADHIVGYVLIAPLLGKHTVTVSSRYRIADVRLYTYMSNELLTTGNTVASIDEFLYF